MNKEQIISKIVKDLPIKEMLSQMSDEEWYGWFEECWNKAINYNRCCMSEAEQLSVAWKSLEWVGFTKGEEFTDDDIQEMLNA